jgi:hypothetical protein
LCHTQRKLHNYSPVPKLSILQLWLAGHSWSWPISFKLKIVRAFTYILKVHPHKCMTPYTVTLLLPLINAMPKLRRNLGATGNVTSRTCFGYECNQTPNPGWTQGTGALNEPRCPGYNWPGLLTTKYVESAQSAAVEEYLKVTKRFHKTARANIYIQYYLANQDQVIRKLRNYIFQ